MKRKHRDVTVTETLTSRDHCNYESTVFLFELIYAKVITYPRL